MLGLHDYRWSIIGKCMAYDSSDPGVGNSPMQVSIIHPALEQSIDEPPYGFSLLESLTSGSWMSRKRFSSGILVQMFLLAYFTFIQPSMAAVVNFENCMSPIIVNSGQLQFNPLFVNATFNSTAASHNLNITVYGDVMGGSNCPNSSSDPLWSNLNETLCKIPDIGPSDIFTTLKASFNVLDYTPYTAPLSRFCNGTLPKPCPITPSFETNP